MGAIAGIDNRALNPTAIGKHMRGTRGVMPDDYSICADRLKSLGGVFEALPLADARALGGKVDDIGRQALGSNFETDSGASRVFKEQVDNRFTAKCG